MNCKGGYLLTVFLRSFYNTEMHVLSFNSHFRIVFMFSILGDEVSHVSPFSKPFWKSLDAPSGFSMNIRIDLKVKLGLYLIYLYSVEWELVHGMIKSIVLKLNHYGLWPWNVSV